MKTKPIFLKLRIIAISSIMIWTSCTKGPNPNPPPPPAQPFYNIVADGLCKITLVPGAVNHVDTIIGAGIVKIIGRTLYAAGAGAATVSIKELDSLTTNGSSFVEATTTLNLNRIAITGNGLSKMDLKLAVTDSIAATCNGFGPYILSGNTSLLRLALHGAGAFKAFNLLSQDCYVTLLGAGVGEVYASNSLTAGIYGWGVVYYKGNPPIVSPTILGLGTLVKK
ncbi:MAG: DUF2807 domain-containing protein [Bacteroidetes bacterium]|nr:DUF2807 domain-containing protein [Bacteroidota bacterium]